MSRMVSLPKWARDHINKLEREKEDLQEQVVRLSNQGPADSNVHQVSYTRPDVRLGKNEVIRFDLPGGAVEVTHDGQRRDFVEIRTNSGCLVAQPQSSNVLRVKIGDWW